MEGRRRFSFICRDLGEITAPDRSQFVKIESLVRRDDVSAGGEVIVTLNTPGIRPAVGFRFA